jgi:hypothetical protein
MARNKNTKKSNDLDLHGVKHQDAEVIVEEHVLLTPTPFHIITGQSNTMKQIVKKVLERHDFQYIDGLLHNTGCIVVL